MWGASIAGGLLAAAAVASTSTSFERVATISSFAEPLPKAAFTSRAVATTEDTAWVFVRGTLQRYRLDNRGSVTMRGEWQMRPFASATDVDLAPFGNSSVWVVDRASRQAILMKGGVIAPPVSLGERIGSIAAAADGRLFVNTPEHATDPFALLDARASVIARVGPRIIPRHTELGRIDNEWLLAAAGDSFIAAHRYRPLLRRYSTEGKLFWEKTITSDAARRLEDRRQQNERHLRIDSITCCLDVALTHFATALSVHPSGEIAVRYGLDAALDVFDSDGGWLRRVPVGRRSGDGWWTAGFALAGNALLAVEQKSLELYRVVDERALRGSIVDSEGTPIKGARLTVRTDSGASLTAASDGDGRFTLTALQPQVAGRIEIEADGYLPWSSRGVVAAILSEPVVLTAATRVCITAIDADTRAAIPIFEASLVKSSRTDTDARRSEPIRVPSTDGVACVNARFAPPFLARVTAEGYAAGETLVSEEKDVALELPKEARLIVTVKIGDTAASGASVEVDANVGAPQVSARAIPDEWTATTSEAGRAVLRALPAKPFRVTVLHPDAVPWSKTVELRTGENPLEVALDRGSTLQLRVTSSAGGKPVGAAAVAVEGTGQPIAHPLRCETDSGGRCAITSVPPGRYFVHTAAKGHTRGSQAAVVAPGASAIDVEVLLVTATEIDGHLAGLDAYEGVRVTVSVGKPGVTTITAPVNASGAFRINDAPTGRVNVWVDEDGRNSTLLYESFDIPETAERYPMRLSLAPPLRVSGTVTLDGRRCPSCEVEFDREGADVGRASVLATTDANGRYSARLPSRGVYTATARERSSGAADRTRVSVDFDRSEDFHLGGAALSVAVATDRGEPVNGAMVELYRPAGRTAGAMTDPAGRVSFEGVAAGAYELVASDAATGAGASRTVEIRSGENSFTLELIRHAFRFRLTDAVSGAPVPLASFRLGPRVVENVRPDGEGVFTVPASGAASVPVVVRARGYAIETLPAISPERVSAIALAPGGRSFRVHVSDALRPCTFAVFGSNGAPVALSLWSAPGRVPLTVRSAVFYDQKAGTYTGVLHDCGGGEHRQTFTLAPGMTPDVQF